MRFGPSHTRMGLKDIGPPPGPPPTRPGLGDLPEVAFWSDMPPPQPAWDRSPNAEPPSNNCEHRLRVRRLHLHFASLHSDARVSVQLTLAFKGAPEQSTTPGHAHRHMEPQGNVCLELLQRDDWLVSTNECDKNKGEVRPRRGELHVPLDDKDLDIGTAISVTQRWW